MNKKRILLVHDEIGFTRLFKLNLEQTNDYEVRVENWAEDALTAAREFRPDLVLLDVVMPRLIGRDVASRLGCISGLPFIAKPVDFKEVVRCIEKHVRRSSMTPAGGRMADANGAIRDPTRMEQ